MKRKSAVSFPRIIALLLVICLTLPMNTNASGGAAIEPRANDYIGDYDRSITSLGGGKIRIYFSVWGKQVMDEIGVSSIALYESVNGTDWSFLKNITPSTNPAMLAYDASYNSSSVDHYGIAGRYYKAYIRVWCKNSSGSESIYVWTSVVNTSS